MVGLSDLPRPNENIEVIGSMEESERIDSVTGEKYVISELTISFLDAPYENYLSELNEYLDAKCSPLYEQKDNEMQGASGYVYKIPAMGYQKSQDNPYENAADDNLIKIAEEAFDEYSKVFPMLYDNNGDICLFYIEDNRDTYYHEGDYGIGAEDLQMGGAYGAAADVLSDIAGEQIQGLEKELQMAFSPYSIHIVSVSDPQ